MHGYNKDVAAKLDQIMRDIPEAKAGKMFGMPGYMVNGKLAVGVHNDDVVAKVGVERAKALVGTAGIDAFEPMPGRPWKDWIALTGDLDQRRALLEEAVRYVAATS